MDTVPLSNCGVDECCRPGRLSEAIYGGPDLGLPSRSMVTMPSSGSLVTSTVTSSLGRKGPAHVCRWPSSRWPGWLSGTCCYRPPSPARRCLRRYRPCRHHDCGRDRRAPCPLASRSWADFLKVSTPPEMVKIVGVNARHVPVDAFVLQGLQR